jgi:hypothetical protein
MPDVTDVFVEVYAWFTTELYPAIPEFLSSTYLEYITHVLLKIAKEEAEDKMKSIGMNHSSSLVVKRRCMRISNIGLQDYPLENFDPYIF